MGVFVDGLVDLQPTRPTQANEVRFPVLIGISCSERKQVSPLENGMQLPVPYTFEDSNETLELWRRGEHDNFIRSIVIRITKNSRVTGRVFKLTYNLKRIW